MPSQTTCPNQERIDDLLANRLPAGQADEVRRHVADCPSCRQRLHGPSPPTASYPFLGPAEAADEIGRLGKYRIKSVLGEGGMAVVFQAEDPVLGRHIALKVLRPENRNPALRERFLREARALANLPDDHVVHLYEVSEVNGVPYMAMEQLHGESLEDRLQRDRTLPVAEALAIARETAEGLVAVHENGLIHRDVKPSNIWLEQTEGPGRRVKLIDFGIARAVDGDSNLTLAGHVVGTPAYMAPEQAAGMPLDGRADLYSLGGVLFRMITGRSPHDSAGPDTMDVLRAVIHGDAPEVSEQAPHLSRPVAELIQRLLSPRPSQRPASARVVVEELRRLAMQEGSTLADTEVRAQPAVAQRPLRRPTVLGLALGGIAILAALVVGAVMAWQTMRSGTTDEPGKGNGSVNGGDKPAIKVGFLFSMTGPMSIHEQPIVYAAHLAVDEINKAGGVLGRPVEAVEADGASDETEFRRQARVLLEEKEVEVIFGCWTSASRKRVGEVCAAHDRLLFYPCSYEGLEDSPHVVYLGGTPNQNVVPLVRYAYAELHRRRFFLVGSEAVYSRALGVILEHEIKKLGGAVVGKRYLPVGDTTGVPAIVTEIKAAAEADKERDLFVINSLDGSSNVNFCNALRKGGVRPGSVPTAWLNISEPELSLFRAGDIVGDYSAAGYFESLDLASNRAFLQRLRKRSIPGRRVNDPMESTYAGLHLWKKAVEKAGRLDPKAVREALRGLSVEAPEGPFRLSPDNLHALRTARVGRVVGGSPLTFEVVSQSPGPVKPVPFPEWRTRAEWDRFLRQLYVGWGDAWEKHR